MGEEGETDVSANQHFATIRTISTGIVTFLTL